MWEVYKENQQQHKCLSFYRIENVALRNGGRCGNQTESGGYTPKKVIADTRNQKFFFFFFCSFCLAHRLITASTAGVELPYVGRR